MASEFDRYFLHLPPFDRSDDFDAYWSGSVKELKQVPIEPVVSENRKKTHGRFSAFDISFKSMNRSVTSGTLFVPNDVERPHVIILVPDYNVPNLYQKQILDRPVAYFFLNLRGHDILSFDATNEEERTSPGYMVENILDPDLYYVRSVYLDLYRAIDMLRLRKNLDCSAIGIIGKGLGAAAALFAASRSDRVKALVLETPGFCYLPMSQNVSESDSAREINDFLQRNKSKNRQIKKNLTYFDALNFADKISCPTLVTVGFKDKISPPQCVFALFNHLLCDKTIEVYPDQGNEAGGQKQLKKSITWLTEILAEE